jgi:hypothetical protein
MLSLELKPMMTATDPVPPMTEESLPEMEKVV